MRVVGCNGRTLVPNRRNSPAAAWHGPWRTKRADAASRMDRALPGSVGRSNSELKVQPVNVDMSSEAAHWTVPVVSTAARSPRSCQSQSHAELRLPVPDEAGVVAQMNAIAEG